MKTIHYKAAGGIVLDDRDRVLVLERDVVRDGRLIHEVRLPKGHIDGGESPEQAALRETCEESGYCDLEILADLGPGRSEYEFRGRRYVRDERYFLMRARSLNARAPQAHTESEESLFRPVWLANLHEALRRLTYDTEKDFAQRAIRLLANHP